MATLLSDLDELEAEQLEVVVPTETGLREAALENITIEGPQGGSPSFQIPDGVSTCVGCASCCCTCSNCTGCCGGHLTEVTPRKPTGEIE